MWTQVVGWLLAILGVAASANLLAGVRARRLRVLRAEAELLASLPAGTGRDALASHLDHDVAEYVRMLDDRRARWTAAQVRWLAFDLVTTVVPLSAGAVLIFAHSTEPWPTVAAAVAIPVALLSIIVDTFRMRRSLAS